MEIIDLIDKSIPGYFSRIALQITIFAALIKFVWVFSEYTEWYWKALFIVISILATLPICSFITDTPRQIMITQARLRNIYLSDNKPEPED